MLNKIRGMALLRRLRTKLTTGTWSGKDLLGIKIQTSGQSKEILDSLEMLWMICQDSNRGAFDNGITDDYGTIDEGAVSSWNQISKAETVLRQYGRLETVSNIWRPQ